MSSGKSAPPTMAITIIEPAILVFGPKPLRPRAKMVGNISDIKKLVRKRHHTPAQLGLKTETAARPMFITLYVPISRFGAMKRMT